jgi:hypothetical protein
MKVLWYNAEYKGSTVQVLTGKKRVATDAPQHTADYRLAAA